MPAKYWSHEPQVVSEEQASGGDGGGDVGGSDGGGYKCHDDGRHVDHSATSENTHWPWGTCCNDGGVCSDPHYN